AFVVGADRAFFVATLFLAATLVLIRLVIRPSQPNEARVADAAVLVDA
ncbi:MAG: hypothetical protein QOF95_1156, partial [Pseudonocardiales bacterium]|nr:hypothetical protein [Pseudonocardiales bacterium]